MAASAVPAFLTKLWTLVDDPQTNDMICWDYSGTSFHITDQARFAKELLPLYFKHSNIASFIRQLNMYGFRKVTSIDSGALKVERDDMEFTHQFFQRNEEHLLEHIKRKVKEPSAGGGGGGGGGGGNGGPEIQLVLKEVRAISTKQSDVTNQLSSLKSENESLWREVANLRNKHHTQQKIVNKLIHFLVGLMDQRPRSGKGMPSLKRRLMIDSDGASSGKYTRLSNSGNFINPDVFDNLTNSTSIPSTSGSGSGGGSSSRLSSKDYQVQSPPEANKAASPGATDSPAAGPVIQEVIDAPQQQSSSFDFDLMEILNTSQNGTLNTGAADYPTDLAQVITSNTGPVDISNIDGLLVTSAPSTNTSASQQFYKSQPTSSLSTGKQQIKTEYPSKPQQQQVNRSSNNSSFMSPTSSSNISATPSSTISSAVSLNLQRPMFVRSPSRPEMEGQIDSVQSGLDHLKELLGSQFSGDGVTMETLFNPETPLTLQGDLYSLVNDEQLANAVAAPSSGSVKQQQLDDSEMGYFMGNQLMAYNPTDLGELFDDNDLPPTTPQPTSPTGSQGDVLLETPKPHITMEEVD